MGELQDRSRRKVTKDIASGRRHRRFGHNLPIGKRSKLNKTIFHSRTGEISTGVSEKTTAPLQWSDAVVSIFLSPFSPRAYSVKGLLILTQFLI